MRAADSTTQLFNPPDATSTSAGRERLLVLDRRWTVPILFALLDGPQRFTGLRRSLPELSANVLTRRLRDLEHASFIVRDVLPAPANVSVYRLSDDVFAIGPLLRALRNWVHAGH